MKSFHNIEKSAFRRGEYVRYAASTWRITKTNSSYGNWIAQQEGKENIYAFTLEYMSKSLEKVKVS